MKHFSFEEPFVVHWFRRDLRWHDNRALHAALTSGLPVLPVFVFDENILQALDEQTDARVTFLHDTLGRLQAQAKVQGGGIWVHHGSPAKAFELLASTGNLKEVHTNEDYEPYAKARDEHVSAKLKDANVIFHTHVDHVIKAPGTVLKPDGTPYTVFTPFSKRWHLNLDEADLSASPSENHLEALMLWSPPSIPSLADMGFSRSNIAMPEARISPDVLEAYADTRDIPSIHGTSRISVHLRFGTISIREAARAGIQRSEKWLTELIWRDFYQSIMHAFPHSVQRSFKPAYDRIPWRHDDEQFDAWKQGRTGYPLVDAGMRELTSTGFMHNRVRMVVASFFCKHLLLDWRLGERFFAAHLIDFELASNVGGWQWAAGSGCDAAPYFRVFNPTSQLQKFDPNHKYVRQWVPEFGTSAYPEPIVEHKMARQRAIDTYRSALA